MDGDLIDPEKNGAFNANDRWWAWMHKHRPKASSQEQALLWELWCIAWTGGRIQERMQHEADNAASDDAGLAMDP